MDDYIHIGEGPFGNVWRGEGIRCVLSSNLSYNLFCELTDTNFLISKKSAQGSKLKDLAVECHAQRTQEEFKKAEEEIHKFAFELALIFKPAAEIREAFQRSLEEAKKEGRRQMKRDINALLSE